MSIPAKIFVCGVSKKKSCFRKVASFVVLLVFLFSTSFSNLAVISLMRAQAAEGEQEAALVEVEPAAEESEKVIEAEKTSKQETEDDLAKEVKIPEEESSDQEVAEKVVSDEEDPGVVQEEVAEENAGSTEQPVASVSEKNVIEEVVETPIDNVEKQTEETADENDASDSTDPPEEDGQIENNPDKTIEPIGMERSEIVVQDDPLSLGSQLDILNSPLVLADSPDIPQWGQTSNSKVTTSEAVKLGVVYEAPQNSAVTVRFTKLPENPGKLSIEEVRLTEKQKAQSGALSDIAYDITSDMKDGTFEYELTLPKPKNQENVEIKFAESISEIDDAETVAEDQVETTASLMEVTLDHFTIFFPAVGAPPLINAISFATRTGDITNGNAVDINLTGVTQGQLDTVGNITVSEACDLQITFPVVGTLPVVPLNSGSNPKTLLELFGFPLAITPSDLATTAAGFGGVIPVVGTLTDGSGNVTDIDINISMVADITAPTISAMTFASKTGTVTGGNTVALDLSGVSDANLASAGSINVSETSTLQITSPATGGPIALNAGNNVLTTASIFGYSILASELRTTAIGYGGLIPVQGTLTDLNGNATNVTINITVDITAPTISAMTFASKTGTVTGGNTVALDLSGVSDANLASAGSINVSETSTLQITSPATGGPIALNAGNNVLTTASIFGYSILASELRTTAIGYGGLIPVQGTLTDLNGNATNVTINISYDLVAPVITLLGSDPVDVQYGSVYVDAGATASDNVDGNITGSIVTVNPVNTNILGTYTVTYNVTDRSGNVATEVTRTVNVIQADITVTADPQTKVYGDPDPALTYQITSGALVGADTFTGALTRDAGEDVGTYAITQGTLALSPNYNLTFVGDDLTITQAALVITADNQTVEYGNPDPVFTFTALGFVNGENISVIDTVPVCGVSVAHVNVGTYPIVCSGGIDNNYSIGYVDGTLTVVDLEKPIITLVGGNVSIKERRTYVEQGATWTDNVDGSGVVTDISGSVNTRRPGTYILVYSYTDSSGNVGTAQRIVKIRNVSKDDDDDDDDDDDESESMDPLGLFTGGFQTVSGAVEGDSTNGEEEIVTQEPQGLVEGAQAIGDDMAPVTGNDTPDRKTPWVIWAIIIAVIGALGLKWLRMLAVKKDLE